MPPDGSDRMMTPWPIEFHSIASSGYYVALRLGFAFPLDERNEFPKAWVEHYTGNGFMMRDPVVRWAYDNTGAARWSDLADMDTHGVLASAREYGLCYGAVVSCVDADGARQRSFGSFARPDREFTAEEISVLRLSLLQMHERAAAPVGLTEAECEALGMVRDGLRLKEIAYRLGVSEGAIKQRLSGAKRKLSARTNTQAVNLASRYQII